MPRERKGQPITEWAEQVRRLRGRLDVSQSDLGSMVDCSAMTVSRWESGQVAPTAHYYIELGKLADKSDCWFFWELAGLQRSDVMRVLPAGEGKQPFAAAYSIAELASDETAEKQPANPASRIVPVRFLDATAGTHGEPGDKHGNLNHIPSSNVLGAPTEWCPNPTYTSLLRVRGHSMETLIHDGDIVAVDSSQTDRAHLGGKVVIVSNNEKGLCVSRLRRYPKFDILESENREYGAVVLDKKSGWRIVGCALWWISHTPYFRPAPANT